MSQLNAHFSLIKYYAIAELRARKLNALYIVIEPIFLFSIYYFLLFALMGSRSAETIWSLICGIFIFHSFRGVADEIMMSKEKFRGIMAVSDIPTHSMIVVRAGVGIFKSATQMLVLVCILTAFGQFNPGWSFLPFYMLLNVAAGGIGLLGLVLRSWSNDFHYLFNEGFRVLFFTSGVIFTTDTLSAELNQYLGLNPILVGIDMVRRNIIGEPSFAAVNPLIIAGFAFAVATAGLVAVRTNGIRIRNAQ